MRFLRCQYMTHVSQYGESKLLLLDLCWKYASGLCPVNSQVSHLRCLPVILRLLYLYLFRNASNGIFPFSLNVVFLYSFRCRLCK